jgi:hypothetical protein
MKQMNDLEMRNANQENAPRTIFKVRRFRNQFQFLFIYLFFIGYNDWRCTNWKIRFVGVVFRGFCFENSTNVFYLK